MSEGRTAQLAHGGLVAGALILTALVVLPIWRPILLAAVLAAALWRLHERLASALHGRRSLSALVLTLATLVLVLVPLTLLALYLVGEAVQLVGEVRDILRRSGPSGLLTALPDRLEGLVRTALSYLRTDTESLAERLRTGGMSAVLSLGGVLASVGGVAFQLALMLIAQFFFLREGHRIVRWVAWAYPLPRADLETLLADFRFVARNVIGATVVTAAIQAVLATTGYAIAGLPAPILFGAVTMFMAFVPALGTPAIGLPLAAFQYLTGHPWQGLFLAVWAVAVVGMVDNVLRPLLIRGGQGGRLHGTVLFFALIGGIAFFGLVGLVVGPLTVVLLDSVLRLRRRPPAEAGA